MNSKIWLLPDFRSYKHQVGWLVPSKMMCSPALMGLSSRSQRLANLLAWNEWFWLRIQNHPFRTPQRSKRTKDGPVWCALQMETQNIAIYLARQFNRQAAEACPQYNVPEIEFVKCELLSTPWSPTSTAEKFYLMVSISLPWCSGIWFSRLFFRPGLRVGELNSWRVLHFLGSNFTQLCPLRMCRRTCTLEVRSLLLLVGVSPQPEVLRD